MPLFLVSCVCDEGVDIGMFRVVEATDRLGVAAGMLKKPGPWQRLLERARLWGDVDNGTLTAEDLLVRIDATRVDGDSSYQLAVLPVPPVEPADDVRTLLRYSWE